jgi:hypothetical protein
MSLFHRAGVKWAELLRSSFGVLLKCRTSYGHSPVILSIRKDKEVSLTEFVED